MILSDKEIKEIMDTPRNGKSIVAGGLLQDEHKLHITGSGYKAAVSKVEGFESTNDFNVRVQIAQPATIQITAIILDNLNRWTTSQGTVKKQDFGEDKKNKAFEDVLDQVWHGDSFDKFINTVYKEAIYTEFNGFVLATKPKLTDDGMMIRDGVIMKKPDGELDPYLVFLANADIYDFQLTGDKVEYLIIKLGDDWFRLIDDEKDIIFLWRPSKGKTKFEFTVPIKGTLTKEGSFMPNEIGYVPARKVSSINKKLLVSQTKTSPIDHIMPALNRYFSSDADLRMQFIRHNYPKLAIVTKECTDCQSNGYTIDPNKIKPTKIPCTTCDGTGKVIPIFRSGVLGLPQNLTSGDTPYPGTPASYITPDTESLQLGLDDLLSQRENIIYSGTGDKNLIGESLNTATENLINSRSLEDRIKEITQMVEDFEVFMKTAIKDLHNTFSNIEQYFIIVRYGKRISIRNEDELLQEMESSKKAGMPTSYILALHRDLIFAKYKNNSQELERQLLLAEVEPLSGYTVEELMKIEDKADPRDLLVKINFDSLISELEETDPKLFLKADRSTQTIVKDINKKIDEILQERIRTNTAIRRSFMGATEGSTAGNDGGGSGGSGGEGDS